MLYISRIGIACVAAVGLSLAACNGDKPEEAEVPAEPQQSSNSSQTAPPASGALDSDRARYSYTIGYQIGSSLQQRLEDIDAETLAQGVREALSGTEAQLKPEEMQAALETYQQMQTKKAEDRKQAAAAEGTAFLEANRDKEGVTETESGLQYQVIESGSGKQPKAEDTVEVHYRGTLLDGTEFDSSYSRGESTTLPVSGVIPGWQEALQLMKEGGKWKIFVPPKLAYGEQGAGDVIGPNETLVFEIELLSVKGDDNAADGEPGSASADQSAPQSTPEQPQEPNTTAQ